jgi:hypothetical protein
MLRSNQPRSVSPAVVVGLCLVVFGSECPVQAGSLIVEHIGNNDPLSEGLSLWKFDGGISASQVTNDMGYNAWSVSSVAPFNPVAQAAYTSGPLTSAQLAEIGSQGFTMSLLARVVSGPTFDNSTTGLASGGATLALGGVRFDLDLGLNSQGDTVAVLASSLVLNQDRTISSYGDSYTLTGSGSSYHLFQLYENPTTGTADLYVDGVLSLSDYSGTGINALNYGLVFGAVNGGDVNFSLVSVVAGNAIPEPSTLSLLGTAAVIGLVVAARRALTATACRRSRAQH